MPIPAGTHQLGAPEAQLLLKVYREGLAAKVGHDLVLEVRDWKLVANVDADNLAGSTLSGTAAVTSFEIVEASGGAKPLSDGDRSDIKKNTEDKILNASKFPTITFASTSVTPKSDTQFTVTGDLTIVGNTRSVSFDLTIEDGRGRATTTILQTEFGIKPFKALMGALKLRDAVDIIVDVPVPKE